MKKWILINQHDNVMVALEDLFPGDVIRGIDVTETIPRGHKVALTDIEKGSAVIKYGYPIGTATANIRKGQWVHTHNVATNLNDNVSFIYEPHFPEAFDKVKEQEVSVFLRKNGEVGIRNELIVLPTVGCVNRQAQSIVEAFLKRHTQLEVDGVHAFSHPYGCSQMGDDHINTRQTLQNIAKHPNFGGVLVLGLGCENNRISTFKATLGEYEDSRIRFLVCQDVADEIEAGADILDELYEIARHDQRTMQPLAKINIGLKCGGSDGLSGITANPLIGRISDYVVSQGGSAVLTEIPEMFGAENVLLKRCETKEVFDRLVDIIDDFKDYYRSHNQVIYENPSPGNKDGGITTLEDKSLGCVQKSGSSKVVGILDHTEKLEKAGLNILSAPGNDMVATTALGMCGCQLVLFSTGRGTPFGGFVPTLKISTNTSLFEKKPNWIDFDSGDISDDNYEIKIESLINLVIEVIEGKKTRNEINEFREIAIFKKGVTL